MSVFDLHVHTVRGSSDSSLTPQQLIKEARKIGLDGVCLTEHSGGWDGPGLLRAFEETDIVVVKGLEVETDMGHVLVFGLHSYIDGIHRVGELRRVVDKAGGVMLSAHPFRNLFNHPPYNLNLLFGGEEERPRTALEAATHPLFELVDDLEVANGSNTERENRFALEVARHLGLRGTGGSDAHSSNGLGKYVTVFDGEVGSEAELIEALKTNAYVPAHGLHLGELRPIDSSQGEKPW